MTAPSNSKHNSPSLHASKTKIPRTALSQRDSRDSARPWCHRQPPSILEAKTAVPDTRQPQGTDISYSTRHMQSSRFLHPRKETCCAVFCNTTASRERTASRVKLSYNCLCRRRCCHSLLSSAKINTRSSHPQCVPWVFHTMVAKPTPPSCKLQVGCAVSCCPIVCCIEVCG